MLPWMTSAGEKPHAVAQQGFRGTAFFVRGNSREFVNGVASAGRTARKPMSSIASTSTNNRAVIAKTIRLLKSAHFMTGGVSPD